MEPPPDLLLKQSCLKALTATTPSPAQGSEHKEKGNAGRHFPQKTGRATASEGPSGLTRRKAAPIALRPSLLQKDDEGSGRHRR